MRINLTLAEAVKFMSEIEQVFLTNHKEDPMWCNAVTLNENELVFTSDRPAIEKSFKADDILDTIFIRSGTIYFELKNGETWSVSPCANHKKKSKPPISVKGCIQDILAVLSPREITCGDLRKIIDGLEERHLLTNIKTKQCSYIKTDNN